MTAIDHAQTVADAALLPAPMLAEIIATYRELSNGWRELGDAEQAAYCIERADALAYGGSLNLEAA